MDYRYFGKIKNCSQMIEYFDDRHFRHSKYFHYSSLENINSILESNEFWLGQVKRFNDSNDSEQFDDGNRNFSLCFSSGINENLPLWYFYGGISGQGARISFTKAKFKTFYENAKFYLFPESKRNESIEITENNASIKISDVLYFKEDENANRKNEIQLKYNNLTNYILKPEEFQLLKNHKKGFMKSIAWFYEKETRIHIRLNDELAKKIDKSKVYHIAMHCDDLSKYASITFAPNITKDMLNKILKDNKAIEEIYLKNSRVQLSEYNGSVYFNLKDKLCDNCNKFKEKLYMSF